MIEFIPLLNKECIQNSFFEALTLFHGVNYEKNQKFISSTELKDEFFFEINEDFGELQF